MFDMNNQRFVTNGSKTFLKMKNCGIKLDI